jgi:hypothetical protein
MIFRVRRQRQHEHRENSAHASIGLNSNVRCQDSGVASNEARFVF